MQFDDSNYDKVSKYALKYDIRKSKGGLTNLVILAVEYFVVKGESNIKPKHSSIVLKPENQIEITTDEEASFDDTLHIILHDYTRVNSNDVKIPALIVALSKYTKLIFADKDKTIVNKICFDEYDEEHKINKITKQDYHPFLRYETRTISFFADDVFDPYLIDMDTFKNKLKVFASKNGVEIKLYDQRQKDSENNPPLVFSK